MINQIGSRLTTLLAALARHDERTSSGAAAPVASFLLREDGMVSWATLVAMVFFTVLANFVANIGMTVSNKIETQNSADSIAYSSSVWMARSMNAVTTANHLMGELTGLYVIHHAFGAQYMDDHYQDRTPNSNWLMDLADAGLKFFGGIAIWCEPVPADSDDWHDVMEDPVADTESTIFDAKLVLKFLMVIDYIQHIEAAAQYWLDFFDPIAWLFDLPEADYAKLESIYADEKEIATEYHLLTAVENLAINLVPTKKFVVLPLLDALWLYERTIVESTPVLAELRAIGVASANKTKGFVPKVSLPVEQETTDDETRSQLIRASYPWVCEWRPPIVAALAALTPRSFSAFFYMYYTNKYGQDVCAGFRADRGYRLFVMRGLDVPDTDKSQETWASDEEQNGNVEADNLYCVLGFARQTEAPTVFANPFFRQANPDGIVCFAQAMIYNSNAQQTPQSSGGGNDPQPTVGWDTLNWVDGANEYPQWFPWPPGPRIRLAWKAKLVPVTTNKLRQSYLTALVLDQPTAKVLLIRLASEVSFSPLQFSPH